MKNWQKGLVVGIILLVLLWIVGLNWLNYPSYKGYCFIHPGSGSLPRGYVIPKCGLIKFYADEISYVLNTGNSELLGSFILIVVPVLIGLGLDKRKKQ